MRWFARYRFRPTRGFAARERGEIFGLNSYAHKGRWTALRAADAPVERLEGTT